MNKYGIMKDREMVVKIMTRMGTNMLLSSEQEVNKVTQSVWALRIANVIVILEHYNGTDSFNKLINSLGVATKIRDLDSHLDVTAELRDIHMVSSSGRRGALKFFSKRTPCLCLKKMHQEARTTLPKLGRCTGCDQIKERVALSVCSRCMVDQYCSRECQVADWHTHRKECDLYVNAHPLRNK